MDRVISCRKLESRDRTNEYKHHNLRTNFDIFIAVSSKSLRSFKSTFYELSNLVYSCFEKGCPTEKHKSVRDNTERHDGLWLFTVASSSSQVFSAMEGGAMNTCLRVLKETKWINILSFY